ncbi:hemicentin-2-like isoform X2 [Lineus longissimus]
MRTAVLHHGKKLALRCSKGQQGGPNPDSWKWFKDGYLVLDGNLAQTFLAHDTGKYICQAYKGGLPSFKSVPLRVIADVLTTEKPRIGLGEAKSNNATLVEKGVTIILTCYNRPSTSQESALGLTWRFFKDGKPIAADVPSGDTWFTTSAVVSDAGSYQCQVIEDGVVSALSDPLNLTVAVAPRKPVIKDENTGLKPGTMTVNTNEELKLVCVKGPAGPIPDSWWWYVDGTRDNRRVTGAKKTHLVAAASGTEKVQCRAFQLGVASPTSDAVTLVINEAPIKPVIAEGSRVVAFEGMEFKLTCRQGKIGIGATPTRWKWEKDGVQTNHGVYGAIFRKTAVVLDAGRYCCLAGAVQWSSPSDNLTLIVTVSAAPKKPVIKTGGDVVLSPFKDSVGGEIRQRTTLNPGDILTLTCAKGFGGAIPDMFKWYKDNTKITAAVTGATLTKTTVTSDAGTYKCEALKAGQPGAFSNLLTLSFNAVRPGKPVIEEGGKVHSTATVDQGSAFILKCTGETIGEIPDAWLWYKDGRPSVKGATLSKPAVARDAGSYQCLAGIDGTAGPKSDAFILTVNSPPDKPLIITENVMVKTPYITVCNGANFTLTCTKGSGGVTPDSWEWHKNGNTLTIGVSGATFTKTAVVGDVGSYQCKAVRGRLASSSDNLSLRIAVVPHKPRIMISDKIKTSEMISQGMCIMLTCDKGEGGRSPRGLSWKFYKDGKPVATDVPSGDTWFTKSAVASDAGSYQCQVIEDEMASALSEALDITVVVPPEKPFVVDDTTGLKTSRMVVNIHEQISVSCVKGSGGSIPDKWWWYENGTRNDRGVSPSYRTPEKRIAIGNSSGSEMVQCRAFRYGLASPLSDALVLVISDPTTKPFIVEGSNMTINEGMNFTLTCSQGSSGKRVTTTKWMWVKDGVQLSGSNSSAIFTKTAVSGDAGRYWCLAGEVKWSSPSENLTLVVNVDPDKPYITERGVPTTAVTLNIGAVLKLTCNKRSNGPIPVSWKWYRNHRAITVHAPSAVYRKTVEDGDTGSSYQCQAFQGQFASVLSDALKLTVTVVPGTPSISIDGAVVDSSGTATLSHGKTLMLSCQSSPHGATPNDWDWYKDNKMITEGVSGALFTKAAATSDTGSYRCNAWRRSHASNTSVLSGVLNINVKCPIDVYGRKYERFKDKMLASTSVTRIYHTSRSVLHCVTTCLNLHQCDCSAVEYNFSNKACAMVKAVTDSAMQSQAGMDLLLLK